MIQGIIGFAEVTPAIILNNDGTAFVHDVTTTSGNAIVNVDYVNSTFVETADGEFTAITGFLFTGVYVKQEGFDALFLYQYSAKITDLGKQLFNGVVVGLYCPLAPSHVIIKKE